MQETQQDTAAEKERQKQRTPKRMGVDLALALLIIAGLITYMGVTWWLHPPRWEAITIREDALRMLDALVLAVLVMVWLVVPLSGGAVGWPALRDLCARAVLAYRRRRRQVIRRLRAERRARESAAA